MVVSKTDMLLTLPGRHAELLNTGFEKTNLKYRVYPCPLPAPRLEAHLYWHESAENDPANRWLREEIEKVLAPKSHAPATLAKRRGAPRRRPHVC
jgi:DNA-binding transcriptional LysR family regulator